MMITTATTRIVDTLGNIWQSHDDPQPRFWGTHGGTHGDPTAPGFPELLSVTTGASSSRRKLSTFRGTCGIDPPKKKRKERTEIYCV